MGGAFARGHRRRSWPLAGLLAIGALVATPSTVALQDLAELIAKGSSAPRWQAHLVPAPQGSIHTASLRHSGAESSGAKGMRVEALGAGALVNIGRSDRWRGAPRQAVNRDAKGDLLMTRMAARARTPQPSGLPEAAVLWRLDNIFSDQGDSALPRMSLGAPAHPAMAEMMAAYQRFLRPGAVIADMSGLRVPRRQSSGEAGATDGPASAHLVAYAPADPDIDAPFDALMGRAPDLGEEAEIDPGLLPRSRPDEVAGLDDAPRHTWADNPLPDSVHAAAQQSCLARGIYFEARGESLMGQAAVAQVILNRVKNPAYPSTICDVVYQNRNWRNRCQFSFACDGRAERIRDQRAWSLARRVAQAVTDGDVWLREVGDATHYHAAYVRPRWARSMTRTDQIGRHIFYRTLRGGWI